MFEITRRNREFSPVRDLMDFFSSDPFVRMPFLTIEEEGNLPLDIVEGENEVIVRASMPGFKKEDVQVHVENGVLTISAEHKEETETKDERYYRRERRIGAVSRRIALPGVLDEAKAEADLTDGVLTLRIPQAEEAKPKSVRIN